MKTSKLQLLGLALSLILLAACSSGLIYQPRPEFTPDGYTDTSLGNRQYKIVYESYRKDAEEPYLMEFALRRAGEIAAQNGATYFDVASKKFDFYQSRVQVPEQIIMGGSTSAVGIAPMAAPNSETIIPAHFRDFLVKRVTMVIQLPAQNVAETPIDKPESSNASE